MINQTKESLAIMGKHQPIMAFLLLFSLALAGETIFADALDMSFAPGLKYGMAVFFGFCGVIGVRHRYKTLSKTQPTSQEQGLVGR